MYELTDCGFGHASTCHVVNPSMGLEQRVDERRDCAALREDDKQSEEQQDNQHRRQPVLLLLLQERNELADDGHLGHGARASFDQNEWSKCFGFWILPGYVVQFVPRADARSGLRPTRRITTPTGVRTTAKNSVSRMRELIQPSACANRHQTRFGMRSARGATRPEASRSRPIVSIVPPSVGRARHSATAP